MKVDFYRHNLGHSELGAFSETLNNIFLTSGPKTKEFEELFATYLRVNHSITVSSWTTGAFLVLKAWGVGPGDEVIIPSLTFISCANVVEHCGAHPIFVDCDPDTGLIDLDAVKKAINPNTKVVMPVHLYGQMVDMKALRLIADDAGIKVLEDSAHCIEGHRDGIRPGQLGDAAVFSFYATKNLTCGEGGAIATNAPDLAEELKVLRLHGMDKSAADRYTNLYSHWDMIKLGYKSNLSDLSSCLLLTQMKRIDEIAEKRKQIYELYCSKISSLNLAIPKIESGVVSANHLFTIWVPETIKRDDVLLGLQSNLIGVAVNYRPVHQMTYYQNKYQFADGYLRNAERIGSSTISLPFFTDISKTEVNYVCDKLKIILDKL